MHVRENDEARRRSRRRLFVAALVPASLSALALCGCASQSSAKRVAPSAPKQVAATPKQVAATPTGGSAGVGPVVVPDGRQDAVLPDRTLTVRDAVREAGAGSASIRVDVVIRNAGPTTIANASTFFRLMGPDGDIFGVTPGSSTSLDGAIDAHTSRAGTVSFEVPAAATASWRLLYRPGLQTQTVMIAVNVG